jgi:predicted Zn-dependent protease
MVDSRIRQQKPLRYRYPAGLLRAGGAAIAMLALAFAGCATSGINKGDINLISSGEEVAMGQEFAAEIGAEFEIYDDAPLTAYVQSVGNRITAICDRRDIDYHFAVIKSDEMNAFALPGGYIYIYTGLMKAVDDEAQLAAVLAHEVGHVTARHATERLTAMYGAQAAVSLLLGENPAEYQLLLANIFSTTGFLAYSRANEYEADRLGTSYTSMAGYDPEGMAELLGKFVDTEASEPSKLEQWLSTHPPARDRIGRVEVLAASLPLAGTGERNAARYAGMKARLP